MSKTLRVAQVGCGGITGAWFSNGVKIENLEYVALVDLNPEAAQKRKDEFSLTGAEVFTDLGTAIRETNPDVVFDCTIPAAHTPTALLAFEHGVHVMSEKPMSDSLENARRALDASRANGRIYTITQNYRYSKGPRRLRQFLASGAIGQITTINGDMYLAAHFGGFRDQMEHVLLLDMAIHTFDMARYIAGADPVSVYCKEWNPGGSWYAHDASAIAVFTMSNGLVFTYRGSWCSEGMNTTWEGDWRAVCENGSVTWDGANKISAQVVTERGGFHSKTKALEVPIPADGKAVGHAALINEFVDCVRLGKTPQTICTDNIKSFAMVMAALESSESGKVERVKF